MELSQVAPRRRRDEGLVDPDEQRRNAAAFVALQDDGMVRHFDQIKADAERRDRASLVRLLAAARGVRSVYPRPRYTHVRPRASRRVTRVRSTARRRIAATRAGPDRPPRRLASRGRA